MQAQFSYFNKHFSIEGCVGVAMEEQDPKRKPASQPRSGALQDEASLSVSLES
jgi:hypothetical protein